MDFSSIDSSGQETLLVELTPAGRGAVAVLLVAGPRAAKCVSQFFRPAGQWSAVDLPLNRVVYGQWGLEQGEELVVCRRAIDQLEVHCHGGGAPVRAIIEQLLPCGCRQMTWQEWLQRHCGDPIHASAQIALTETATARTAAILLDQLHGALAEAIQEATAAISADDWPKAADIVETLLSRRELGLHLTTPWQVVVAGAPNAGKSSIINALAGYERAIVSPIPGTTRDVVTVSTAIDGWPVQLADTAGLRETRQLLEAAGIELATKAIAAADLVVLVEDIAQSSRTELAPIRLRERETGDENLAGLPLTRGIHVLNKIDLLATPARSRKNLNLPNQWSTIETSALTGEGIGELIAAIASGLVPIDPPRGAGVPFTAVQVGALAVAKTRIEHRDASASIATLQSLLASPGGN